MPIAAIFSFFTSAITRTLEFFVRIPASVYAGILLILCVFLAANLHTTKSDLRQTRAALEASTKRANAITNLYSVCTATLTKQTSAIANLKTAADEATSRADEALRYAAERTRRSNLEIAALRKRPTPPPAVQCATTDALLNEFIPNANP